MSAWAGAAGVVLVGLWIAAAPPWRDGRRGLLRVGAALLLLLGLFDVSCRLPSTSPRPRLEVLIDRSESMRLAAPDGASRVRAGEAWLARPAFARWTEGWEVRVDSFGGTTSDPGHAVERASLELPDAILVVTDGRVSGGRSIGEADVPVYVFAPDPVALPDAAVLELSVAGDQDQESAVIVVAATGGLAVPAGRVELAVDGRPAGGSDVPALAAGERRVVRLPIPPPGSEPSVLSARISVEGDAVPANDARSRVRERAGPRRALAVALGPTWDFAVWLRALEESHPGPVDALWSFPGGVLRSVEGGEMAAWGALDDGRYAAAYLFGDPAALGSTGRAWIERFAAAGGRGLLWAPAGWRGDLPGAGVSVQAGRPPSIPRLTPAGREWLAVLGAHPGSGPDGGAPWPPLEQLPAASAPPADATVLLEAGGSPSAWVAERGARRVAVVLGTGAYRWSLEAGTGSQVGPAFWGAWSDAVVRWLAAASPAIRPLVRLPAGRMVSASEPLRATIAEGAGSVRWQIEAEGEVVERGELAAADSVRSVVAGPHPSGIYRLHVETSEGRSARELFVIEPWSPELAWTAADTGALRTSARLSGGAVMKADAPAEPLQARGAERLAGPGGRRLDLGTWPWTFLAAAVLILADWALTGPGRR